MNLVTCQNINYQINLIYKFRENYFVTFYICEVVKRLLRSVGGNLLLPSHRCGNAGKIFYRLSTCSTLHFCIAAIHVTSEKLFNPRKAECDMVVWGDEATSKILRIP